MTTAIDDDTNIGTYPAPVKYAMQNLPPMQLELHSCNVSEAAVMYPPANWNARSRAIQKVMEGYKRAMVSPASTDVHDLRRLQLQLEYDEYTGAVQMARVTLIGGERCTHADVSLVAMFNKHLEEGGKPPYIKTLGSPPTEEQCAALFKLCSGQAFVFRLIARTLLAEKAYAAGHTSSPPTQLRLACIGQAGTGKSESLKAALWFAFQHDISHFIGVSSFQWKAALIMTFCCLSDRFFFVKFLKVLRFETKKIPAVQRRFSSSKFVKAPRLLSKLLF